MKRKLFLVLALSAMAAGAGAWHRKHKQPMPVHQGVIAAKMRFGACYGRCPEYSVEINRDGTITYTGIRFTADTGTFTKKADAAETGRILDMFETDRIDTCANRYRLRIPDVSVMHFYITYNDSVKTIMNATFGPAYLQVLCSEMNAIGKKTDNDGWKRMPDDKPKPAVGH